MAIFWTCGNRRAPSKSLILKWIKQPWDAISPDIIRKSFKKCEISNALDGSEDNLFQNEGDDDPFEGFDEEDVRMDEEILANVCHSTNKTPKSAMVKTK